MWKKPTGITSVIEVSVPKDARVCLMRNGKREKYVPYIDTLRRTRHKHVDFVLVVIDGTGVVCQDLRPALVRLGADIELSWLQNIAATATVHLLNHLVG